jgi:hypothetical protein
VNKFDQRPTESYHSYLRRLNLEARLIETNKAILETRAALLINDAEVLTTRIKAEQANLNAGQNGGLV